MIIFITNDNDKFGLGPGCSLTHYIVKNGLELLMLLSSPSKWWHYICPPWLDLLFSQICIIMQRLYKVIGLMTFSFKYIIAWPYWPLAKFPSHSPSSQMVRSVPLWTCSFFSNGSWLETPGSNKATIPQRGLETWSWVQGMRFWPGISNRSQWRNHRWMPQKSELIENLMSCKVSRSVEDEYTMNQRSQLGSSNLSLGF